MVSLPRKGCFRRKKHEPCLIFPQGLHQVGFSLVARNPARLIPGRVPLSCGLAIPEKTPVINAFLIALVNGALSASMG